MAIEWSDEGIVLAARPHGESALVLQLLTREHGRHAGLLQGGQSRRRRSLFEPGSRLSVVWRARLAEHLGQYTAEATASGLASLLELPGPLAALASCLAVAEKALPEREPHRPCYDGLVALIEALDGEHWGEATVLWELQLLAELGYGLDLTTCAVTGAQDDLAYVSPRSGRAVSLGAAVPYRERLLALPGFLVGRGEGGAREVLEGLTLTGHFLEQGPFQVQHQPLPAARQRLQERFAKAVLAAEDPEKA